MNLPNDLTFPQLPGMDGFLLAPDGPDLALGSQHIDVSELYLEVEGEEGVKREPKSPPSPDDSDSGLDTSPTGFQYGDSPPLTPPQEPVPTAGELVLSGLFKEEEGFVTWETDTEICFEGGSPLATTPVTAPWTSARPGTGTRVVAAAMTSQSTTVTRASADRTVRVVPRPAASSTAAATCLTAPRTVRPALPATHTYIITAPAAVPLRPIVRQPAPVVPTVATPAPHPVVSKPDQVVTAPRLTAVRQLDLRVLKRQERMIKNRQAATLSRKKKKDQFHEMEARTKQLEMENARLRDENQRLHRQLAQLAAEVDMLRQSQAPASPPPSPRRPLMLFSVLLLASLNFAPIRSFVSGPSPVPFDPGSGAGPPAPGVADRPGGRTLLWAPDPTLPDVGGVALQRGAANVTADPDSVTCPRYNQTEARRLSRVLHGWFDPGQRPLVNSDRRRRRPGATGRKAPAAPSRVYVDLPSGGRFHRRREGALQPYRGPLGAFMDHVPRRDDTFYVISFSGHRLLLPALNHSQIQRPRMSLLLSSPPLNESMRAPEGSVAMMQIDCEVTNTRLLHIPEAAIPAPLPAARNGSAKSADASASGEYGAKLNFGQSPLEGVAGAGRWKLKRRVPTKRDKIRKLAGKDFDQTRKAIHRWFSLETRELDESASVL